MYITLSIDKGKVYLEREIFVEYTYERGGDGWNEDRWMNVRITKVFDVYTEIEYWPFLQKFRSLEDEITDIIQRFCDIYNFDLWGYISDRITERLS